MTTAFCSQDIATDEGCRLNAYPDPLSGAEPWTIGYGHAVGVSAGMVWSQEECDETLSQDIAKVESELDRNIPWWRGLSDERQDVLVNMCFNMGWGGLSDFHHALAALESGSYNLAANQFLDSLWAKQVPNRANRLCEQIRTGVRA